MNRLLTLFLLLATSGAWGQVLQMERTGYMGGLFFFAESQVSMNTETFYHTDNTIELTIQIVTPGIKIGIPTQEFLVDRMITVASKPFGMDLDIKRIKYKIDPDTSETDGWYEIPKRSNEDSDIILLDTLLNGDNPLRISFKDRERGVFQIINIEKKNPVPEIRGIKHSDRGDTTIASLRKLLARQKDFPEGFTLLNFEHIEMKAGNTTELIFSKQSVYPDSSILYRYISGSDTSNWQRTGHFHLLNQVKSNHTYLFELRYDGSNLTKIYEIRVLPHWYEKTTSILILILMVLLLAAVASYLTLKIKWNREQKRKTQNLLKLKAVQAQLNPHFIFNALSSIQGLINLDKKADANKYLTNFSDVLRLTLTNSDTMFVSLASELELLKNYLDIEQLRFQFSFQIIIDPALNTNDIEIPPMLLQPSIENAIKHGGGQKGRNGRITLTIEKEKDGFYIEIFDNGI